MTVAAENTGSIDRAAAEQRMNEIYRKYWNAVHMFILVRVDDRHRSIAEDLAADTFVALWTKYLAAGKDVFGPWALLCAIARTAIMDFYKVKANRYLELAVDFSDPANRGIGRSHTYAPGQPEAAVVAQELNAALERMTELSKQWRDKHAETHMYRSLLDDDSNRMPLNPKNRRDTEAKLTAATAQNTRLLESFRQACARVGELRIELEEAGGPNWCSSTGLPPTANRSWLKPGTMSDPTRTHCDAGHQLTLENTHFTERGAKRCRTCTTAAARASHAAKPKPQGPPKPRGTSVPEETIQRARELLKDPSLSLRKVAATVGMSRSALCERIPDLDQIRDTSVRRCDAVSGEVIEAARRMLADPACAHLRVQDIAKKVGTTTSTLYGRLPVAELRRAARDAAVPA